MNTSLIWMWLCLLLESKGAYRRMSWSWGCGWLKCVPLRKARAMDNPREIGKQIDWGTQIHINPPEKIRNSQTGVSRLKEKLGGNHRKRWALCCKGKYSVTTPGNEKKGRKKRRGRRKEERGISVSLSVCWYIIKDTDRLTLSTHTHTQIGMRVPWRWLQRQQWWNCVHVRVCGWKAKDDSFCISIWFSKCVSLNEMFLLINMWQDGYRMSQKGNGSFDWNIL